MGGNLQASSIVENVHTTKYDFRNLNELAEFIEQEDWCPGIFKQNYRNLQNFQEMTVIGLDFDGGMTLTESLKDFKEYQHIIATTRSHQKYKNGLSCDRFRVILTLERPIRSDAEYKATFAWLRQQFPAADEACSDASRMFYKSEKLISVAETGLLVPVQTPATPAENRIMAPTMPEEVRGKLSRATLEFIASGAEPGTWNKRLFKAAKDMQEQGFPLEDAENLLEKATGTLDATDISTITSAYKNPPKHEPRDPDEIIEAESIFVTSEQLMDETLNFISNPETSVGTSTGWKAIDAVLGGLRCSELGVIQAFPKTGKTIFLINLMANLAAQNKKVGCLSLEMLPRELDAQLYSILLQKQITQGEPTDDIRDRLKGFLKAGRGFTYYQGSTCPSIDFVTDWIKRAYFERGIRFLFLDHFHKIDFNEESRSEVKRTLSAITALKHQLPELSIVIVIQPTKPTQYSPRVSQGTLRGSAGLFEELSWMINIHSKFMEEELHEFAGKSYTKSVLKSYPRNIRELEFEGIRANPWSKNSGEKIYMEFNHETCIMKPVPFDDEEPVERFNSKKVR